jgi:CBS domain-containing protein
MQRHGIMVLPVVDAGDAGIGVIHRHDLMRAEAV